MIKLRGFKNLTESVPAFNRDHLAQIFRDHLDGYTLELENRKADKEVDFFAIPITGGELREIKEPKDILLHEKHLLTNSKEISMSAEYRKSQDGLYRLAIDVYYAPSENDGRKSEFADSQFSDDGSLEMHCGTCSSAFFRTRLLMAWPVRLQVTLASSYDPRRGVSRAWVYKDGIKRWVDDGSPVDPPDDPPLSLIHI